MILELKSNMEENLKGQKMSEMKFDLNKVQKYERI